MIQSVRQTVLGILSKNNFGYLSPSDFNSYCKEAQLEIFRDLFTDYNKQINKENARQSGTEFANIRKQIEEVIEIFSVTNFLTPSSNNIFNLPSLVTTGDDWFTINKILCYPTEIGNGTNTSVVVDQLVNTSGAFTSNIISANDIVVNLSSGAIARVVSVLSATAISLTVNIFTTTPVDYLILKASVVKEAEKVSHSKSTLLNNSNLTAPNNLFPAYTEEGNLITLFPSTLDSKGQVLANYIKLPLDPKWSYVVLSGGEPVFDATALDYQDFQLPNEYEPLLITKILQQAGMELREGEVVQYSNNEELKENAK